MLHLISSVVCYSNEILAVCWFGLVVMLVCFILGVVVFAIIRKEEPDEMLYVSLIGMILIVIIVFLSISQLFLGAILLLTAPVMSFAIFLLPVCTFVVTFGAITQNNPRHVGYMLAGLGWPMIYAGVIVAFGCSVYFLFCS